MSQNWLVFGLALEKLVVTNFDNIGGVQHRAAKTLLHLSILPIHRNTFLGVKWSKMKNKNRKIQSNESMITVADSTKEHLTKSKKLILSRWGQIQKLAIISSRNQLAGIVDRQAMPDKKTIIWFVVTSFYYTIPGAP